MQFQNIRLFTTNEQYSLISLVKQLHIMNDIMDSYESMEEKELMASKVNTHGINAMNLIFCHVLVINA